jgi:Protein of unknown function (DUF3040)
MSDDDHVSRAIEEIERALRAEDPSFMRRSRDRDQRPAITVIAVLSLLAASAVLLSLGLATASPAAWYVGVVACGASFLVDRHFKRHQRGRVSHR